MATGKNTGVRPFGKRLEGYVFEDAPGNRSAFVYVGEYYDRALSDLELRRRKFLYPLLSICGAALFFAGGSFGIQSNAAGFTAVVSCILILNFLWLSYIMVVFVTRTNHLTVWEYRVSALQLGLAARIGAGAFLLLFLFTPVYSLLQGQDPAVRWLPAAACQLLGGAALTALYLLERGTGYSVRYPS